MFHISTEEADSPSAAFAQLAESSAMAALSRFCIVDEWSANLDSAMLHLGAEACTFHGLDPAVGRFGILDFVRCYEAVAAAEIVNVFERAAATQFPFHYSAELKCEGPAKRLVHCFGQFTAGRTPIEGPSLSGVLMMTRRRFRSC